MLSVSFRAFWQLPAQSVDHQTIAKLGWVWHSDYDQSCKKYVKTFKTRQNMDNVKSELYSTHKEACLIN